MLVDLDKEEPTTIGVVIGIIIFKPGPVKGPGSGFWPGHRVGWINPYFLKNSKQRHFSKKKNKSQRVATEFLTGFCRVNPSGRLGHTGSWLFLFFLQPGPVPASGRPGPGLTCRAGPGFKTMIDIHSNILALLKDHHYIIVLKDKIV